MLAAAPHIWVPKRPPIVRPRNEDIARCSPFFGSASFGLAGRAGTVASSFDPATLSLTGWWRADYAGSPWAPTASAGSSGSNGNLSEATNPPGTGSALNGLTPADFDGSNDRLRGAASTTFLSTGAGSIVCLFNADAAVADPGASAPYNAAYLVGDTDAYSGGTLALGFTDAGVRFGFFTVNWDSIAVACATGGWHLAQAKFNGTTSYVRVDNGSWTSHSRGAWDPTISAGTDTLLTGTNYNETVFFNGRIAEIMTASTALSDADFDNIRAYMNARYALAI